jgi:hypothetical protein
MEEFVVTELVEGEYIVWFSISTTGGCEEGGV